VEKRPRVRGSAWVGRRLSCDRGRWDNAGKRDLSISWYRSNIIGSDHPRLRAPAQEDLGMFDAPADPRFGTQPLPYRGPLKVGEGKSYKPTADDVGKMIYCQVSADNDGATVWRTASAPTIRDR
jgi:hypothetical protein